MITLHFRIKKIKYSVFFGKNSINVKFVKADFLSRCRSRLIGPYWHITPLLLKNKWWCCSNITFEYIDRFCKQNTKNSRVKGPPFTSGTSGSMLNLFNSQNDKWITVKTIANKYSHVKNKWGMLKTKIWSIIFIVVVKNIFLLKRMKQLKIKLQNL